MNRQEYLLDIIKTVVVSEKSNNAKDKNTIVLKVSPSADKRSIKDAVEAVLSVKVDNVHTLNVQGKVKRNKFGLGKRKDWKKAYVTLSEGQDIEALLNASTAE